MTRRPFASVLLAVGLFGGGCTPAPAPTSEPEPAPDAAVPDAGSSPDNSFDGDGFLWGTEASVTLKDSANLPASVAASRAAINGTVKTKFVKIRPQNSYFSSNDGGATYSPSGCLPSPASCVAPFDMDETVKLFKANGWSMFPMFTYDRSATTVSAADIDRFVNFVSWFVDCYQADASIQYIELEDFPASWWKGTDAQLVEMTNKVYDRVKASHPAVKVGTPGFEYWSDTLDATTQKGITSVEVFLNPASGAKFDYWAFHGYPLIDILGAGAMALYPPTRTAAANKYAGVPGILEIRKALDANGWQSRPIIDSEHFGVVKSMLTDPNDRLEAAYLVQHDLLERTLRTAAGAPALTGVVSLKLFPSGTQPGDNGALNPDGGVSKHVVAVGLLREKLHAYKYVARLSGAFDDESQPWVEQFKAEGKELYVFFKPFGFKKGSTVILDGQKVSYSLSLGQVPSALTLTDCGGTATQVTPAQTLLLEAENTPKFLEVSYGPP